MDLKITIIQTQLIWENVAENLNRFSEKIASITDTTDIIVLPEMFNTGFSMCSEKLAETMDGLTVTWMKETAKKTNAVIVGSLIIEEHNKYYNRLVWAQPDGDYYTYNKRHLFRMANEHKNFSAGHQRLIVNYKGWRICPMVCYDLRFPVWSRNTSEKETPAFDMLIYVANWPEPRKLHWSKLLEARAIENQCYVVGVNRIGEDENDFTFAGNSVINNFMGEAIASTQEKTESIQTVSLSLDELNTWREKFPVSMDGDEFELTL